MADFNAGDVVTLKSGGPRLTVGRIWSGMDKVAKAEVFWFDDKELKTADVPVESLAP